MRIEAFERLADLPPGLPVAWNRLLAADQVTGGVDTTATFEWHASLLESFLSEGQARLLVAYDDNARLASLLPCYQVTTPEGKSVSGRIATWSELYCGCSGLLLDGRSDGALPPLMSRVDSFFPAWNCLELTLSDGNGEIDTLARAVGDRCLTIVPVAMERSPYVALPLRFDEYVSTLKPNFRVEVRRGTRRLGEQGQVESRLFRSVADVTSLWNAVCAIERQSWKEGTKTSITTNPTQARFYEALLPRAAAAGQLCSTVLYLDGRPIAHQLCVQRDATASILKMSFVEDLRRYYPATVLLAAYIRDMIEMGLRNLDFMGVCDDFKMRWTKLTYGRSKYLVFRRSLSGRIAYWRRDASQRLKRASGLTQQSKADS